MKKLVLAAVLAGTALLGFTAAAAEARDAAMEPAGAFKLQQTEAGLPGDVSFGLFGHSHRYDPPPPPPGDPHDPPPPPPPPDHWDHGPRIDGRYGPHHPSPTSGAKYGPREYNE